MIRPAFILWRVQFRIAAKLIEGGVKLNTALALKAIERGIPHALPYEIGANVCGVTPQQYAKDIEDLALTALRPDRNVIIPPKIVREP